MAKALKVAAIVVGVAAIALTAGTALGIVGPIAIGTIGATTITLTTALTLTAAALSVAAGLLAKPPNFGSLSSGTQLDFLADPSAGEPYVMGKARVGEAIVHEASWGTKNKFLGIVGVLSCAGPIFAYNGLNADDTLISFSGRNATGYYANFLYLDTQLGARPEAAALDMSAPDSSPMPDWDAASKLSSLAATGLVLVADIDNGKVYSGGVPKLTHDVQGVLAYDPRLDSTNGGSGSQRPGGISQAETAYAYSENPWVHHGTYALGRWVNGVKVIGPGLPATSIDWASHIEAANVADANGWKVSGRILSTDSKWETLKAIAQAGGGYPIPTGAKLAALVNTPRVSLETIEEHHLKGPVSIPQVAPRRSRLNGAIPRYRSADHAWEVVSGGVVRSADYLAADGGSTRTKEVDLPLVADTGDGAGITQAAQLAAYEVANSRERSPITLELDLYWSQYKMGDCLTLNIPSALLFNQKCIVIGRELDAAKNTVTFDFCTEDDAKHTWALSVTGTAAPPTTVGSTPGAGDTGGTVDISSVLRNSYPSGMRMTATDAGTTATIKLDGGSAGAVFKIEFATNPAKEATVAAANITGLAFATVYYPYADVIDIDAVIAGTETPTYGAATSYSDALNSATHPRRIYLGRSVTTPADGAGDTTGGGTGGGYSGGGFDNGGGGGINYP